MNKNDQIMLGAGIIVVILVGMFFWYRMSIPTQGEINSSVTKIQAINPNVLTNSSTEKISAVEVSGQVPVEVKAEEIGKTNPFGN